MENKIIKEILEWAICIILAVILAVIFRYNILTPAAVKQDSMTPTLSEGEKVIISRIKKNLINNYERGDIITFEAPSDILSSKIIIDYTNPIAQYNYEPNGLVRKIAYYVLELNKRSYIKRIIGLPGDRIEIKNGNVYVNNIKLDEDYLTKNTVTKEGIYNNIIVPEGTVFVLGDNRDGSLDSRFLGCIPIKRVEGKVIFRYWPLDQYGKIE